MWKQFLSVCKGFLAVIAEELYAVALHIVAVFVSLLEFVFWALWISPRLIWRTLRQLPSRIRYGIA